MAEGSTSIEYLLANAAKTNADFNFGKINDAYRQGQDYKYQQDLRNAFKDENGGFRQDLLDDKGNPDSGKMYQRLMMIGGAPVAEAASKLAETGFMQDRYRNAPTVEAALNGGQPTLVSPPSANRTAPVQVAPALARGGLPGQPQAGAAPPSTDEPYRGGDSKSSLIAFLSNNGVPEQDQGSAANILGGQLAAVTGRRVDPNAPLDLKNMQVRQILGDFQRKFRAAPNSGVTSSAPAPTFAGGPQSVQAPQNLPTSAPTQPSTRIEAGSPASYSDPTLGGLVPVGYDPAQYVQRLEALAGSGRILPDQLKVLQSRIDSIRKAMEPTPDMKNARAAGMSVKDYLDRNDNAQTDRAVLTNSILPKLDKSFESASAARDEITSIHRAMEQMDAPGGIFTGTGAPVMEKLAKMANFLGVPGAEKIENTETFKAAIGQRVMSLVKNLGSGSGITDSDLRFTQAMAGGSIELNEGSIRRILGIGEKAARAKIDQHNRLMTSSLRSNKAIEDYGDVFRIEQPGSYRPIERAPASPAPVATPARAAAGPQQFSSQMDPRRAGAKSGDIIVDENGRKFRVR